MPDDGQLREDLRGQLRRASALVREPSRSRPWPGPHCRDCAFIAICPAQGAGSVTGS